MIWSENCGGSLGSNCDRRSPRTWKREEKKKVCVCIMTFQGLEFDDDIISYIYTYLNGRKVSTWYEDIKDVKAPKPTHILMQITPSHLTSHRLVSGATHPNRPPRAYMHAKLYTIHAMHYLVNNGLPEKTLSVLPFSKTAMASLTPPAPTRRSPRSRPAIVSLVYSSSGIQNFEKLDVLPWPNTKNKTHVESA